MYEAQPIGNTPTKRAGNDRAKLHAATKAR